MIVIPMAGLSSRFKRAGFSVPKFMLEAHGKTLFQHSLESFSTYFDTELFLFICMNDDSVIEFVNKECVSLSIKNFKVFPIDTPTKGQAETVYLGVLAAKELFVGAQGAVGLTVFNIDTFRPNFEHPDLNRMEDGYLEVFEGHGSNWSFAKPVDSSSTLVAETAEKNPISNLCSTGLYYFKNFLDFISAFEEYSKLPPDEWDSGELYVAPLYNVLINNGKNIHYRKISENEVVFCGVPEEYYAFKQQA